MEWMWRTHNRGEVGFTVHEVNLLYLPMRSEVIFQCSCVMHMKNLGMYFLQGIWSVRTPTSHLQLVCYITWPLNMYSKNPHRRTCGLRTPRLKFGEKGAYSVWKLKIVLIYKNSSLFSLIEQTVSVAVCRLCNLFSNVVCLKFNFLSKLCISS